MSAKTDADITLAQVLASLAATACAEDRATTEQVAAALESCRADGVATMRATAHTLGAASDHFIATQAELAADRALDDAGLDREDAPRLALACAEAWRAAYLCH